MLAIVTGANGFIGYNLVKKLYNEGFEVIGIDINFDRYNNYDDDHIHLIDYGQETELFNIIKKQPYLFYHLGWIGTSGDNRASYGIQRFNAEISWRYASLAKQLKCKKFIGIGTIMEYELYNVIYSDQPTSNQNYIYGLGKQMAHTLCKLELSNSSTDFIWTYITNTFGPGEKSARLINSTLRKILHNEPLEFTSATQNYDFIYIKDVVEALYLIGIYGVADHQYLIGSGHPRPLKSYLQKICNYYNVKPQFGSKIYEGVNTPMNTFSIEKLQSECHFYPQYQFIDGIKETMEWIKEQENQ